MKFNNLHKKDIAHSSYRDDPWKETKYINKNTTTTNGKLSQGEMVPSLFN